MTEEGLATGGKGAKMTEANGTGRLCGVVTGNEEGCRGRHYEQKRVKQHVASGRTGQRRLCSRETTEAEMENTKV